MNKIRPLLNAARKLALLAFVFPYSYAAAIFQNKIMRPVFNNRSSVPTHVWRVMGRMLDIRYEFNGAALETQRPTLFLPNHFSREDFLIGGNLPRTSFMMLGKSFDWPVIGHLARAGNIVGTHQNQKDKPLDLARFNENFNDGLNMTVFAEGITTYGYEVLRFSAGNVEPLFGVKGIDENGQEVSLEKDVVVQPLALRVKSIGGKDVLHDKEAWQAYTRAYRHKTVLRCAWERMKLGRIVIDVTVLPPLCAKDFNSAADLTNEAHKIVMNIVSPDQRTIRSRREYREQGELKTLSSEHP